MIIDLTKTKPQTDTHKERKLQKLFNIDIKSVDESKRQVTFCFSDNEPDRQNEVVDQSTWDVKDYSNNPIILWGHDTSDNRNALGQAVSLDLNSNGSGKSFVTAQFDQADTNPNADTVFRQIVSRTLRCVSASFINHTFEIDEDQVVLKDNELLEISVVSVPANPRAVALSYTDGSLSRKDAVWMRDSMRKEVDAIDAMLTKSDDKHDEHNDEGEDNMEEVKALKEQLATMLEGLAKVTEKLEGFETKLGDVESHVVGELDKLKEQATDTHDDAGDASDTKTTPDASDTAKGTSEAATTSDDAATSTATTDEAGTSTEASSASSDAASTDTTTSTDGTASTDNTSDTASASTDFDENAELTPEVKAQIDAQFEAQSNDSNA